MRQHVPDLGHPSVKRGSDPGSGHSGEMRSSEMAFNQDTLACTSGTVSTVTGGVPLSVRLGWAAFDPEGLSGGSSRGLQLFVHSFLKDGPSLLEKVIVNGA